MKSPAQPHQARTRPRTKALLALLLLTSLFLVSPAQITIQGKLKNFKFPDYYPPAGPGQTNRPLKTLLSGKEAWQLASNRVQIKGLSIESYRMSGQRELEARAVECVFDLSTREAAGPGQLDVTSAGGLYAIQGVGFFWRQSDGWLIISNQVASTVQRGLLTSRSAESDLQTNPPAPAAGSATNEVIHITSDQCVFDNQSNRVEQSGHVLADDPQMLMASEFLQVQFTPAKQLQSIVATKHVSMLNKADQSRVTAGRADYMVSQDKETITLTENPVWRDREAGQEVRAVSFTLDRKERTILGQGGAVMRLPRGSFAPPSLLADHAPAGTNAPPRVGDTNQIQINSETLTIWLPSTNHPQRRATAEGSVVILSPADDTRATGDKAVYSEDGGLMDLVGHAQWAAEGRLIKADVLSMDRTNQVFHGLGHTSFRLPLQQTGQAGLFGGATNRTAPTNLFLEVFADEFTYRSNILAFQGGTVRTFVFEGEALRGLITSGFLSAHFSDRLDDVRAEKHVVAENYPPAKTNGTVVTNLLSCEILTGHFSKDGQAISIVATDNVQAAQVEVRAPSGKTTVSELTCGLLTALVLPKAGRVDKLEAEQRVLISQGDKLARGEKAVYTDKENQVTLSGHPYAQFTDGKVSGAETLEWDRATGAIHGHGRYYHIEWTKPAGKTNAALFPRLKM
ncbi:MAG: hypothetical protein NTW03_10720 [Verrucomicrobia bacterium]|nr:hypothetical protein [Verrucomicrobiota bacterium]